jgi:hypothetical protein
LWIPSLVAALTIACTAPRTAGTSEPARVIELTARDLVLDGERVASSVHRGLADDSSAHHDPSRPKLREKLAGARAIRVVAERACTLLDLDDVLLDALAAGVSTWSLAVGDAEARELVFFDGDPDLNVEDLYAGPRVDDRESVRDFMSRGPGSARRVSFELYAGARLDEIVATLAPASGRKVRIWIHL